MSLLLFFTACDPVAESTFQPDSRYDSPPLIRAPWPHEVEVAASNNPHIEAAMTRAEGYLGTPYRPSGRDTTRLPGLDCQGVIYLAYGSVSNTPWRSYSVDPSVVIASGMLGETVESLAGVTREGLELERLERGDVLYFLLANYVIEDEPLWVEGETRYWPWHTGIYWGDAVVLHSAPGAGVTKSWLKEMPFDRLLVTRLTTE